MNSQGLDAITRGQLPLELGHETSLREDDFVAGPGNQLALAHIRGFPNWPGPLTLLIGPAKSGKSHLARIFADRAGAVVASPPDLADFARAGGTLPLIVEDVDRAAYAETALFHLLNQSMREGRPLLMTARTPVSNWPYMTDDTRSRARLASQFEVAAADDTLLSQMFAKLFADRQVDVDPRVVGFMVSRMERAPEEVVALVELTDRIALARGGAITRAIAAEALMQRSTEWQLELDLEGDADE